MGYTSPSNFTLQRSVGSRCWSLGSRLSQTPLERRQPPLSVNVSPHASVPGYVDRDWRHLRALEADVAPTTPEGFDAYVRTEIAKFQKIVQDAGIKPE